MTEEFTRRSRLAAALIAGPAVTVGMLGAGAAPAAANTEAQDPDTSVTGEDAENSEASEDGTSEEGATDDDASDADTDDEGTEDDGASGSDASGEADPEAENGNEEDPENSDSSEDSSGGSDDDEGAGEGSAEGEEGEDGPGIATFQEEVSTVEATVDGSVVELTGLPEGASSVEVTAADGESVSAGIPEDGALTFDASEWINLLGLEPGENTLSFSWTWFEDSEELNDSIDATVEIEAPDQGEVVFEVEDPVVTASGFPEGVTSVDVESPSGGTAYASLDEDGTLTFDASEYADEYSLDLGFGEQTLTFSWSWYDEAHGEQQDSTEVTVTAVPPLETGEDTDAEDIVGGMIGDETSIENVQSIGQGVQIGQFSGWDALGIPAGVVLSTGDLLESWAAITGRGYGSLSTDLEGEGDADLDDIVVGEGDEDAETHDAAGLEFSFVPETSYVQFSYVFASEEYPDASTWNDVFAFLVNGENYATFEAEDGSTQPVAISTINIEDNSDLYNDNAADEDGERPHESKLNGFTNVLTFTAPVNPGELNTLKLVIGDTNDGIFDSLVFLQSGSFTQIQGPVVSGGEVTTEQGEPVSGEFELDTNIEDPEWSIEVTDGVDEEAGELEIDGTSWTFTPAEDFTGEASFTFTANDGQLTTVPATISITVGEPEDEGEDEEDDESTAPEEDDEDTAPEEDDESTSSEDDDSSEEQTAELTLDADEVAPGDELTVVGEGFEAGEDVTFKVSPELGTFAADENGTVTAVVTIPEDLDPGEYTLTATGESSGISGSVTLTVVEPAAAPAAAGTSGGGAAGTDSTGGGGQLAATGVTSREAGIGAGLLLLLGGALTAVGYRNRLGRQEG